MNAKIDKLIRFALCAPFVVAMVIYGSTKPPPGPRPSRFAFDQYLADTGSYSTNDTVHIAASKSSLQIPNDTSLLVFAALAGTTNWTELTPRRTYADLPADWSLANATNYDYLVALDWVPPTPVVTNDILVVNALAAKDSAPPGPALKAVLPRVALVVPIEYLESTGTQHLSLPINVYTNSTVIFDGYITSHNKELYGIANQADNQFNYETTKGYYRWFSTARIFPPASGFGTRHLYYCSEDLYIDGEYFGTTPINLPNLPKSPVTVFQGTHGNAIGRCWRFAVMDENGVLVFDGRPVRVGGIGAMLDLVSRLLFFNAGTGDFLLGPDL